MTYLYKALEWLKFCFGVFPRSAVGSRKTFLIVHYAFVAIVVLLCAIFTPQLRSLIGPELPNKHLPDFVNRIWWGIVALLLYSIMRVVLYLLQLMGVEDESDFPDIEADWNDILTALSRERINLDDLPLFLVNGFTPQQEQSAFEAASNIEWRVIAPPLTRTSAVVRVFARDDAIFLCCSGIGTTNCQQGKVVDDFDSVGSDSAVLRSGNSGMGTLQAGELSGAVSRARAATGTVRAISAPAAPAMETPPPVMSTQTQSRGIGAFFGTMAPGGLKKAMETFSAINRGSHKGYGKKKVMPLSEVESVVGMRRMQFLCGLITRARRPFCQINGLLQAIPLSWTTDANYARKLAPAIKDDLVTIHESFQLQFPIVAVVTEMDVVSGMKDFLLRAERMQPGLRLSRAGSSFAPGADISDRNAEWIVDRGMQWFRGWVYTAFSSDIDNRDNQKLFYMLCEISQRRNALVTLLRDSLYRIVQPPARLHGVYFTATGRASTEQGFIRGVLDKLPESQGLVAWSPQLVRSQQRSRLVSGLLFAGALLMLAATIAVYVTQIRGGGAT